MKKIHHKTRTALLVFLGCLAGSILISYQFKDSSDEVAEEALSVEAKVNSNTSAIMQLKKADLQLITVTESDQAVLSPISGRVLPKRTTQIFAEVQGKVQAKGFRLKEGKTVRKGEALLHLDAREFQLQLESQRSAFLSILTAMMPDLKADYPDNYAKWLAYVQAYQIGDHLATLPATASEAEKYFVTSNQVYSTYFNIKALEERLSKYTLIAPYSGSITSAPIDQGTLVAPGQHLGTLIDNEHFELEAGVGLALVSKLQPGDQVTFRNAEIAREWTGTVARITDLVDTKTQNVTVFFELKGADLKAGMYLEGSFAAASYTDVFAIPKKTLTRDNKVLLLENNTIKGKEVTLVGVMQDSLLVKGLSANDQLIVNEFNVPVEGMKLSM